MYDAPKEKRQDITLCAPASSPVTSMTVGVHDGRVRNGVTLAGTGMGCDGAYCEGRP